MKRFISYCLSLMLFITISHCKSDNGGAIDNEFKTIEDAFYKNKNWESYNLLVSHIKKRLDEYSDKPALKKEILLKGIKAAEAMRSYPDALGFELNLVKDYPEDKELLDRTYHLGELYGGLDKREAMTVVMASLKEHHGDTPAGAKAAKNLTSDFPGLEEYMLLLRQRVFNDSVTQNKTWIRTFVEASEAYALANPEDKEKAPVLLHQAAEASRSMGAFDRALMFYDWILDKYPNSSKASQALFLKAFTYDNNKKDIAKAREYYNEFLKKYPNDEFADDTKFLLSNLGKSDEEILKQLTSKK